MRIKCFIASLAVMSATVQGATLYVSATGSGNCSSWGQACSMNTALGLAALGEQIWVKAGTYAPINLVDSVVTIGGFAGTETSVSQSNPASNPTIIDGGGTAVAVISGREAPTTELRGFTIQNGAQNDQDGGGANVLDSSPMFVQCVFKNNTASWWGGAVVIRGNSIPNFINCIFHDNGTPDTIPHPYGGGVVAVFGGIPQFTNCLFYSNNSGEGGAIAVMSGAPTLVNCTLANNIAGIGGGGAIFDENGSLTLRNCIAWGNMVARGGGSPIFNGPDRTTMITYSDVHGGWAGTANLNSNPLFANSGSNDFSLQSSSPCKNVGIHQSPSLPHDAGNLDWDSDTNEPVPLDLARNTRKVSIKVDLGAFEIQSFGGGGGQY